MYIASQVVSSQADIANSTPLTAQHAHHGKQVLKRFYQQSQLIKHGANKQKLSISQSELTALIALGQRVFPEIKAQSHFYAQKVTMFTAIQLPITTQYRYLNLRFDLLASDVGLKFANVKLGELAIPDKLFIYAMECLINYFVADNSAGKLIAAIQSVDVKTNSLIITTNIDSELVSKSHQTSFINQLQAQIGFNNDLPSIEAYYQSLVQFASQNTTKDSLANFVNHLFTYAQLRQQKAEQAGVESYSAVKENQSALVALGLYFGSDRFKLLVGELTPLSYQAQFTRKLMQSSVTLQKRNDLQKHFVYSIFLQLFSGQATSDAIGEFKEFLDSNNGGSGFSFADLQADRAGTRLAMIATYSEPQAKQVQAVLAQITDDQLLPNIKGLQEGLSQSVFESQYQDNQSLQYQQAIEKIDLRLKQLNIYQFAWYK